MANSSQSTFLLSAADVTWAREELSCVDVTVAATALDGKYFTVDAPSSHGGANNEFFVWYDLDASSVSPAPAGKTGIEVDVVTGDTAEDVASKTQAAIDAQALLQAKVDPSDTSQVLIKSFYGGPVSNAAADVDTTFDVVTVSSGLGGDLGKTSGGAEVTMESTTVEIKSDQDGENKLDEVLTGNNVECTVSLMEMTPARWKTLVGGVTGDSYTPSGGTELTGFGSSRQYSSLFDLGGRLILHPSRFAASDRSYDITFFKAAPKPASINFSAEEAQLMEVTFTALADSDVAEAIRVMAFGDTEQDVRA